MKCSEVYSFLSQVSDCSVSMTLPEADMELLTSGNIVRLISKEEYSELSNEISKLDGLNAELAEAKRREVEQRAEAVANADRVHSVLFHFQGKEKREAQILRAQEEEEELRNLDGNIASREKLLSDLIRKKSAFDKLTAYDDRYVSLTESGITSMNDLGFRLYRVSDDDFSSYVRQMNLTLTELEGIADRGVSYFQFLQGSTSQTDVSHRWSASIGLAKIQGDKSAIETRFLDAYNRMEGIAHNEENRLTAAEVLASSGADLENALPYIRDIDHEVRHRLGIPKELSASVTSILFFGRRYDGTFPLDLMADFSQITASYESAAIMAIVSGPVDETKRQFLAMKSLFRSWGYDISEDTELSSAYIAVSGLSPEGIKTKLAIITQGLKHYLEYPLVASAILASIPVMEANETLNLLEKAYSVIGSRAFGLEQAELLGLGVRMIHGVRNELVRDLDSTARIAETPLQFTYSASRPFIPIFIPLIVAHSSYYSTFGGIGGVHPGHIHAMGGFYG